MKHDELFSYLNYVRRKDPIGGSISGEEYNRVALIAVNKFFKKIFGLPEQYQKGARDPVFGFGLNQISEEKIKPIKAAPVIITVTGGYAEYPDDYFKKSTCYITETDLPGSRYVSVPFVNDAKFNERNVTVLDTPTRKDPVANLHSLGIRVLPSTIPNIILDYLKYPTTPIMGFAVDNTTADIVYVEHGATCKVLTATTAGGVLTLYVGAVTLGSYTVVAGDSVEEVMQGLTDAINADYTTHQVKAIFDGEQIVLADNELLTYSTLLTGVGVGITIEKTNFTAWSTQFDWENDIESMVEISEIMLDIMGISNRDTNIVQWAEKEKAQ